MTVDDYKLTLEGADFLLDKLNQQQAIIDELRKVVLNAKELAEEKVQKKYVDYSKKWPYTFLAEDLNLSVRAYNCMAIANIIKPDDFQNITLEELKSVKGVGRQTLNEILEALDKVGIELKKGEQHD